MNAALQRRVEERAYMIWRAEGQPHGRHEEHWRIAEREIAVEEAAAKRKQRRGAAKPSAAMPARLRRKAAVILAS